MDLIKALPDDSSSDDKKELLATQERLVESYNSLSQKYHTEKVDNPNNSLVLGWTS